MNNMLKRFIFLILIFLIVTCSYLTIKHYSTYTRLDKLYENQIINALTLDKLIKKYYQDKLSFPTQKSELDSYIQVNGPNYLRENLLKIGYKVIYESDMLSVYDLGFDNDNDSLVLLCPEKRPNFISSMFKDGDFLIYRESFDMPEKLLFDNYFVYDTSKTILPHQIQYKDQIVASRQQFLRNYYRENFSIDFDSVRFNPGKKPDTVLIRGTYKNKHWETTIVNDLNTKKFDLYVFNSLFKEIKAKDDEVGAFYITVLLASSKSQLYLPNWRKSSSVGM